RRLKTIQVPPAKGYAAVLEAGLAQDSGEHIVIARLQEARAHFNEAAMALHTACIDLKLSELVGGSQGESLKHGAAAWFSEQGVRRPIGIARTLLPLAW